MPRRALSFGGDPASAQRGIPLADLCIGAFALFIGFAQQLVDNASSLFFFYSSFLRFLLFGEEPVVHFPAH
jgi:hypothetical protein